MPDDTTIYDIDIVNTLKDLYAPKTYKNESLYSFFFFTCVLILGGKKWVLLVAGSKHYYNYKHQADICNAYKSLEEVALKMKTSLFSCMTRL